MSIENPVTVAFETYAGRVVVKATLLAETPKRYRVRFDEDGPGDAGYRAKGTIHLVPKYAVSFVSE